VVVTATETALPASTSPVPVDSPVAMDQIVRWVSSAKAELAQYQLNLSVACALGGARQCWASLRYSTTVGENITADLAHVSDRPAVVEALWLRTWTSALTLQSVARRQCFAGDFNRCTTAVFGSVRELSQALASWDQLSGRQ